MKLTIERQPTTDEGTFGTMTLDDHREWPCVELPWRDNANGLSCVMPGSYTAKLAWSEHFGRDLYHLNDANGRHAIEIHNANFAGDVTLGWKSQLHGCCAPGTSVGELDRGDGVTQKAVLNSRAALQEFMDAAGGADLEIEISWKEEAQ